MNKGKFTDLLLDAWIFFSGYLSIYILAVLISVLELFSCCWFSLLPAGFFFPCTGIIGIRIIKRSQRGPRRWPPGGASWRMWITGRFGLLLSGRPLLLDSSNT